METDHLQHIVCRQFHYCYRDVFVAIRAPLLHVIEGLKGGVLCKLKIWDSMCLSESQDLVYFDVVKVVAVKMTIKLSFGPVALLLCAVTFILV